MAFSLQKLATKTEGSTLSSDPLRISAILLTNTLEMATDLPGMLAVSFLFSLRILLDSRRLLFVAAFIDPLLASGVHLALTSGLSAAATICASIRGDCTEEEAGEWHTKRFSTSYT